MDIVSHGLWGSLAFGRENKKSFWLSFFFGTAPDLFSFGIFFVSILFGVASSPRFSAGPPDPASIPSYVYSLYALTHSLIIFSVVFLFVWFIRRMPVLEMSAWGLHILVDIPTHSVRFFPTPFLWPLSRFEINGWPWASPWIFIPNITLLLILYLWFFVVRRKRQFGNSG